MRRLPLMLPAVTVLVLLLVRPGLVPAQAPPEDQESEVGNGGRSPIALVVFDFKVREGTDADTGKRIADALSARLAEERRFRVVPRGEIAAGLEKEGLEPPAPGERVPAVEAGHLLGARHAVFGRAFAAGGFSYLMVKVISTEDLSLTGVIVKGAPGEEVASLPVRAAEKLGGLELTRERTDAPTLREWLRERAATSKAPRIAVIMSESHLGRQLPQSICEAATVRLLRDVGLDARSCGTPESQQWARSLRWEVNEGGRDAREAMQELPPGTEDADLLIVGHGWSSTTPKHGSYGKLVICDSRVETKVIDLATGLPMGEESAAWELGIGPTREEAARKALERTGVTAAFYSSGHIARWMEQHPSAADGQEED